MPEISGGNDSDPQQSENIFFKILLLKLIQ